MNTENLKLLNGMHEGLLILEKNDEKRDIMFCNASVKKLLASFTPDEKQSAN